MMNNVNYEKSLFKNGETVIYVDFRSKACAYTIIVCKDNVPRILYHAVLPSGTNVARTHVQAYAKKIKVVAQPYSRQSYTSKATLLIQTSNNYIRSQVKEELSVCPVPAVLLKTKKPELPSIINAYTEAVSFLICKDL